MEFPDAFDVMEDMESAHRCIEKHHHGKHFQIMESLEFLNDKFVKVGMPDWLVEFRQILKQKYPEKLADQQLIIVITQLFYNIRPETKELVLGRPKEKIKQREKPLN